MPRVNRVGLPEWSTTGVTWKKCVGDCPLYSSLPLLNCVHSLSTPNLSPSVTLCVGGECACVCVWSSVGDRKSEWSIYLSFCPKMNLYIYLSCVCWTRTVWKYSGYRSEKVLCFFPHKSVQLVMSWLLLIRCALWMIQWFSVPWFSNDHLWLTQKKCLHYFH